MSGVDIYTWYLLSNSLQNVNNTLTVSQDAQSGITSDNLRGVYLAPAASPISYSQQWQLVLVNSSSTSAYVLRNRQVGAGAFLTTAWTTKKCGGGSCATVPVLAPYLNTQSLWGFGSWGFSDPIGVAFMYSLGNGSNWHLDVMDGQENNPEMTNRIDTGRRAQHWNLTAYAKFAASDTSSFQSIPTTASALLAQVETSSPSTTVITPYIVPSANPSGSQSTSAASTTSSAGGSSGQRAGLSTGASVGIGVGITAVVIIAIAVAAFLLYRRRRNRGNTDPKIAQTSYKYNEAPQSERKLPELSSGSKQARSTKAELMGNLPAEMDQFPGTRRAELDHGAIRHELHS